MGSKMERDTAAMLEGYTPDACRYLCDQHDQCKVAVHHPTFMDADSNKLYTNYCEIMGSLTSPYNEGGDAGTTCFLYGSDRTIRDGPEDTSGLSVHFVWESAPFSS